MHYILATEVTTLGSHQEATGQIEFIVACFDKTLDVDNVECNVSPNPCDPCSNLGFPSTVCNDAGLSVDLLREDDPCCPADLNGDGTVGILDLLLVLGAWSDDPCCCPEDLNGDGHVGILDLNILLANWGPCPVPGQQLPPGVQDCLDKYLPEDPKSAARCIASL